MKLTKNNHLQYAIFKLQYNHKLLKAGAEIRTKGDLQYAINEANKIIETNKLNLKVNSTGQMACRGAFEILEVKP